MAGADLPEPNTALLPNYSYLTSP